MAQRGLAFSGRPALAGLCLVLATALGLTACPSGSGGNPPAVQEARLSGSVLFATGFRTQVGIKEIAGAATVSLIDPMANVTVGTTLTDSNGGFAFNFGPGFAPGPDPYILCSLKSQPLV